MMCMEVQYEDGDEDLVVYMDQGISTKEYEKATYGKLTKSNAKKKKTLSVMWPYAQMTSCHWRRKEATKTMPNKHIHNVSQSDVSLKENPTRNTFNNEAMVVHGPTGDNDETELQEAWMMELPMNNGDISSTMYEWIGTSK